MRAEKCFAWAFFRSKKRNMKSNVRKFRNGALEILAHLVTSFDHYKRRMAENILG